MIVCEMIKSMLLVVFILSASSTNSTTDLVQKETDTTNTKKPYPIELIDLGFKGTWEEFCDEEEIEKLYPEFPEHDLIRTRTTICISRNSGKKPNDRQLRAIVFYKYCSTIKPTFDDFLMKFVATLSLGDPEKRAFLSESENQVNQTECFHETMNAFYKTCAGQQNPCVKIFKLIFARGCEAHWLTTQKIVSYIDEICTGRWVSDNIDWDDIFKSIRYND